ncbi:hypothetical protein CHU98_g2940 [Xylaria longipes]|nr:hypothetical protein CHU98_g2940 [Xylaria longipes]
MPLFVAGTSLTGLSLSPLACVERRGSCDRQIKHGQLNITSQSLRARPQNGKKYAGQKKKQTPHGTEKSGGANKRTLQSRKSEFARRFSTPEVRAKLDDESLGIVKW